MKQKIHLSDSNMMIGGVCGGHGRFVYSDCSSTLVYNVSCGYAACVYNIVGYPSQRDKINKNGVIFYTVFSIP